MPVENLIAKKVNVKDLVESPEINEPPPSLYLAFPDGGPNPFASEEEIRRIIEQVNKSNSISSLVNNSFLLRMLFPDHFGEILKKPTFEDLEQVGEFDREEAYAAPQESTGIYLDFLSNVRVAFPEFFPQLVSMDEDLTDLADQSLTFLEREIQNQAFIRDYVEQLISLKLLGITLRSQPEIQNMWRKIDKEKLKKDLKTELGDFDNRLSFYADLRLAIPNGHKEIMPEDERSFEVLKKTTDEWKDTRRSLRLTFSSSIVFAQEARINSHIPIVKESATLPERRAF